jgi:hypothetical protein
VLLRMEEPLKGTIITRRTQLPAFIVVAELQDTAPARSTKTPSMRFSYR